MADNVGYTPGVGEIIATDDIAGVQYQKVKLTLGEDGVDDGPVGINNPLPVNGEFLTQPQFESSVVNIGLTGFLTDAQLRATALPVEIQNTPIDVQLQGSSAVDLTGESIEALEATRMGVQSLLRSIGQAMPDTAGRIRVNIEAGTLPTITTVSTVTTVTTVSTVSNQTNMGGFSGTEQIPSLMRIAADSLRRNISVT